MNYDVGVFTRRRIISPAESYFAVPTAVVVAAATQWNPSDQTLMNVTNSGRTATYSGSGNNNAGIRSIAATVSNQKVYVEHVPGLIPHNLFVGFSNISAAFDGGAATNSPTKAFGVTPSGQFFDNDSADTTESVIASFTTGARIGIAYDSGAGLAWFRKNGGAWNTAQAGGQDPAAGTGGVVVSISGGGPYYTWYAADADSAGGPDSMVTNFASTSWVDTVPVGFTQLAA